jgi:hypothetical protein
VRGKFGASGLKNPTLPNDYSSPLRRCRRTPASPAEGRPTGAEHNFTTTPLKCSQPGRACLNFSLALLPSGCHNPLPGLHLWVQMPQYFFTVRADSADAQESAADLRDDAAAFAFALDLIQAARAGTLGGSLVKVRDATRPIVFSIPFLPASA